VRPNLHDAPPATVLESLGMLWRAIVSHPGAYLGDRVGDFVRLFRLNGGQWIALQPAVATRVRALALEGIGHLGDVLFAASAIFAPLGLVLVRRWRPAILVALWVVLHLGLLVVFAWNGVRYRAPYEPGLIVLGAIVLAGSWRRPRVPALAIALAASVAIAAAVAISVPETAGERASYGFAGRPDAEGRIAIAGDAGFSLFAYDGAVRFTLAPSPAAGPGPVRVRVLLDGHPRGTLALDEQPVVLEYPWTAPVAYVQVQAADERGQPAALAIAVATLRH
jgi:hypothetical protein